MKTNAAQSRVFWILAAVIASMIVGAALFLAGLQRPDHPIASEPQESTVLQQVAEESPAKPLLPTIDTFSAVNAASPIAQEYAALDPLRDGWTSESMHERIKQQMNRLGELVQDPARLNVGRIAALAAADYSGLSLRPEPLATVFQSGTITVLRSIPDTADADQRYQGRDGWGESVRKLLEPFRETNKLRTDVKIFHVDIENDTATSRAYVVFSGPDATRSIQQNATWNCTWSINNESSPPQLKSVSVEDFEQVAVRTDSGPPFLDCTLSVLGNNHCFREQLLPGIDHWTARIEQRLGMYIDGWSGLAVGDANRDGLDDLYVCQPGGLPNRLFLQNADGTATDVASSYGVDWLDRTTAALLVDFDNDGWQDLAVASRGGVLLMQNTQDGAFKLRQAMPTAGQPYSLAAADYDNDGRLDLYVCCYNDGSRAVQQGGLSVPVPYYDANNGAANSLLRNQAEFEFANVTADTGMDGNNRRFSYACSWEDFDNDGDQDLYVANDFGRNNLYRNEGGRFTDVAAAVGVEDVGSGMSVSWSDYNGDGWMDLYVGNMFSAAGSRVTYQRRFASGFDNAAGASLRRLSRGNTLFENTGDGTMRDASFDAGVTLGRWAWSSNFVDINNDGRDDIVVANGFVTGSDDHDL